MEAINIERTSDNIIQVLPNEVITSLPNTNIADAVGRRAVREPGLDDVNVQSRQLLRHYQFFFEIHRRPRRLFSIAKRRIENTDHACHGKIPLIYLFPHLSSPPVREEKQRGVLALWSAASQDGPSPGAT